jgi:hypothetical protein
MRLSRPQRSTTRTIAGRAILWVDDLGTTHSGVRAEGPPGVYLVWTDCQIDVPPNAAHTAEPDELVTCPECRAKTER